MKPLLTILLLLFSYSIANAQFNRLDEFVLNDKYALLRNVPVLSFFFDSSGETLKEGEYKGWTQYSCVMRHAVDKDGVNVFYSMLNMIVKGDLLKFEFIEVVGDKDKKIPIDVKFAYKFNMKDDMLTLIGDDGTNVNFIRGSE